MSTSIHFLKTVYNKKMSIYPIINYPVFSENTIILEFRGQWHRATHVCAQIANCYPNISDLYTLLLEICSSFRDLFPINIAPTLTNVNKFRESCCCEQEILVKVKYLFPLDCVDRCGVNICKKFVNNTVSICLDRREQEAKRLQENFNCLILFLS